MAESRAVHLQRADLVDLLGRTDEAKELRKKAQDLPLRKARDYYLLATEHLAKNKFREAIPLLQEATRLAPDDFWARFALGVCHHQNVQDQQALGCYDACAALWPTFDRIYYNRGLIYLRMRDFKRACKDFDHFLESHPEDVNGYLSRAQARK